MGQTLPVPITSARPGIILGALLSPSVTAGESASPVGTVSPGVPSSAPSANAAVSAAPVVSSAPVTASDSAPRAASSAAVARNHVTLSWVLHPGSAAPGGAWTRHIDLVVEVGDAHAKLGIDARFTTFFMVTAQPLCTGHYDRANAVGELYMNGGGNVWYTVERGPGGALRVFENASSDGLCTDGSGQPAPCPVERVGLGVLRVPEGARFTERFVEIVEPGDGGPAPERLALCNGS